MNIFHVIKRFFGVRDEPQEELSARWDKMFCEMHNWDIQAADRQISHWKAVLASAHENDSRRGGWNKSLQDAQTRKLIAENALTARAAENALKKLDPDYLRGEGML